VVNLVVVGPNGALGRALVKQADADPRVAVVAGVGPTGRDYVGTDLGLLVGLGRSIGAEVLDSLDDAIPGCDVAIDATRAHVSMEVLSACVAHGKAFVTGTTGFSDEQRAVMIEAGSSIPILQASNGSRVVHLLYELARMVTERFGDEADIDIVEMHNRGKPDAPSGTSQEIGSAIAETLGRDLDRVAEYGRKGMGTRQSESIQFSSIRSGGTPSMHQVIFGFEHERLELTHRVHDPMAFAEGLIEAVVFASNREPGVYTLDDVI
jgi:4-hydroxy-tetrahydrodipicolinate reductase